MSFVADLKKLGITGDNSRLVAFYFVPCVMVIVGTLIFYGISFWWEVRSSRESLRLVRYLMPSVGDYLHYGYSFYRKKYLEALKEATTSKLIRYRTIFIPYYARQLSSAFAAVGKYAVSPSGATKKMVAEDILKTICAVVFEYYEKKVDLELNANYMRACRRDVCPPNILAKLKFNRADLTSYAYVLILEEYAFDKGKESFALPVEHENMARKALPGASAAFLNKDHLVVNIDDTKTIKYPTELEPAIIEESKKYFETKAFRSFACIAIMNKGEKIGIVNVESNMKNVFGTKQEEKDELVALVYPLCQLLGFIIAP